MAIGNVSDRNISDKVADELRAAIEEGTFAPGERLVERKLAVQLGVSHIPVREALARLAEEGLVEREPRRGARVACLTADELAEISDLRIVLEVYVAERAQVLWTPQSEATLRTIVTEMSVAAQHGRADEMFALDRRFHETLWEMTNNNSLMSITSQLRGRINGFLLAANGALGSAELKLHAQSHNDLVEALTSGSPDIARRAMADHIRTAAERISTSEPD
ncbi:GntR family transcriptional regulator [Diaminobutyricibacter sp. McL0608]|uniref:GntR family transcriptional regulator n=1 Tax=Leifsonia sp. McL0608 TaxID=3143537 RepID=UPI0031F2DF4A